MADSKFTIAGISFKYPAVKNLSKESFNKKYGDNEVSGRTGKRLDSHNLNKIQAKNVWDSLQVAIKQENEKIKGNKSNAQSNVEKSNKAHEALRKKTATKNAAKKATKEAKDSKKK